MSTVDVISGLAGIDEGPCVMQQQVEVLPTDTVDSLRARVQAIEPALYVAALRKVLGQRVTGQHD